MCTFCYWTQRIHQKESCQLKFGEERWKNWILLKLFSILPILYHRYIGISKLHNIDSPTQRFFYYTKYPPLERCEIVIWWKEFISEFISSKGLLCKENLDWQNLVLRIGELTVWRWICSEKVVLPIVTSLGGTRSASLAELSSAKASNIPPVWQGLQISRKSRAY